MSMSNGGRREFECVPAGATHGTALVPVCIRTTALRHLPLVPLERSSRRRCKRMQAASRRLGPANHLNSRRRRATCAAVSGEFRDNLKLTFHLGHSAGADQYAWREVVALRRRPMRCRCPYRPVDAETADQQVARRVSKRATSYINSGTDRPTEC
jgi:hypothetical protein